MLRRRPRGRPARLFVADDLQRLDALESMLSLVITFVALVLFAVLGPAVWSSFAVLAPAALAGCYVGAFAARRHAPQALRAGVVVLGIGVGIALL